METIKPRGGLKRTLHLVIRFVLGFTNDRELIVPVSRPQTCKHGLMAIIIYVH